MKAYQLSEKELEKKFNTNLADGLTTQEIETRLKKYGPNSFPEPQADSIFTIILHQFKSPLIYVLFAAAIITIFLQEWLDTGIILFVVIFNAIVGAIQEGRTQKIISGLQKMLKTDSIVIRNGYQSVIPDSQLVPGDIIIIQEGMRIPADVRLTQAHDLQVDESILTGESATVNKDCRQLKEKKRIYEQCNMAFQGTYAMSGDGRALVIATGSNTQIGQLHKTIESISTEFPLKAEMQRITNWIITIVFLLIFVLFGIGYWINMNLYDLLITLTALFVSVIPEGLPVIVTLVLVRGAYNMAKKRFLIKRLQAVEALGRTSIILTDKTGTITHNEMMVVIAYVHGKWYKITGHGYDPKGEILHDGKPINQQDKDLLKKLACSTLMNKTQLYYDKDLKKYRVKGNQTEAAMSIFAKKLGIDKQEVLQRFKPLYEQPFDKKKRYNFGCYEYDGQMICYMTGSPETILKHAKNDTEEDFQTMEKLLEKGLRVIGIATIEYPLDRIPKKPHQFPEFIKNHFQAPPENDIKFAGFFGMQDAIRKDVKISIEEAHNLGVQVAMVTGDHKETAKHIAEEVSIYSEGDYTVTGKEFVDMSEREQLQKAPNTTVYARFVPQEKYELVNTYHKLDNIVAMTGDGVNDAPSLAAADIGIAMGIMGTEVAKQAADAILLDDSFCSIVDGIYEGRNVFYTLRRIILYFFTTNLSEILIITICLFFRMPLPLVAIQILWMNIVTDGFIDIGLTFEPPNRTLLKNNVVLKKHIIDSHLIIKMFFGVVPMTIGSILVFFYSLPYGLTYARTMILTTMILFQWFNGWNSRSEWYSIFKIGLFRNKILILITLFLALLQVTITYTPSLCHIFKIEHIGLNDWLICVTVASSIIIVEETRKFISNFLK